MSKRKKFIITSLVLALGFVAIQFLSERYRYLSIGSLGAATVLLFIWSLKDGLGRNMTILTLLLPFTFTIGVGLFWFLLPAGVFTRIPIVILYGAGIYALCLTSNIYTVAAIRTIALLRSARGVGFVLTLVTLFLILDTILSLRAPLVLTAPAVGLVSFPLFLQGFWSVVLEKNLSKRLIYFSLVSSLAMGEVALCLFFWPVTVVVGSLFLTVVAYVLLGLGQAEMEGRLFSQTLMEYLLLGILVFISMLFATRWGM